MININKKRMFTAVNWDSGFFFLSAMNWDSGSKKIKDQEIRELQ